MRVFVKYLGSFKKVLNMSSEPVSSFFLQLGGTLIGAFVGFGLVIFWDRKKKKAEKKETRNMIIDSLVAEMKENLEGLNKFQMPVWNVENGQFTGDFGLVSISAFQSIVNGGDFIMLPNTLQKPIREIYQNTDLYNKFMNEIIGFSTFNLTDIQSSTATTELIRRLQERISELQTSLPDTIKELRDTKIQRP